jgi:hypothetical protein
MKQLKPIILFLLLISHTTGFTQVMPISFFQNKVAQVSNGSANALDFDGADDILITTNDVKFQTNVGTIEGWIKTSNAGSGYCGAFGKTFACMFYLYNNELIIYDWVAGANRTTGIRLDDNTWHHIAVSYNAGVNNGTLIYIDGVLKLTTSLSIYSQNEPFAIGSNNYSQPFRGSIDDVRVWNVIRTQSQIQGSMNTELAGTETGLVAYYTFNQGIAAGNNTAITTITDKTANALNGTLTNFTKTGAISNFVLGKVAGALVTNGMLLNLDAANSTSYPGNGITWTDLSGNSNNGTLYNGVTYSSANGGSLVFDGADDYADITSNSFGSATVLTIEGFIKWVSGTGGVFLGIGSSYHVWTQNGTLGYNNNGGNVVGISSAKVSSLNLIGNWHHYTFVMRSSGLLSTNKIYIDGVDMGALTAVVANDGNIPGLNNSLILSSVKNGGYYGNMQYANLRIYNRELTISEIQQNFNTYKSRFGL